MKYLGWILAIILFASFVMNQITIRDYKLACGKYRQAIAIYGKH